MPFKLTPEFEQWVQTESKRLNVPDSHIQITLAICRTMAESLFNDFASNFTISSAEVDKLPLTALNDDQKQRFRDGCIYTIGRYNDKLLKLRQTLGIN